MPGYDRCCPYGTRLQTFRNSIELIARQDPSRACLVGHQSIDPLATQGSENRASFVFAPAKAMIGFWMKRCN